MRQVINGPYTLTLVGLPGLALARITLTSTKHNRVRAYGLILGPFLVTLSPLRYS